MTKYAILSDIHGNLFALKEVINDLNNQDIDSIILLGDLIDYGMQSNEVIEYVKDTFLEKNRIKCCTILFFALPLQPHSNKQLNSFKVQTKVKRL